MFQNALHVKVPELYRQRFKTFSQERCIYQNILTNVSNVLSSGRINLIILNR